MSIQKPPKFTFGSLKSTFCLYVSVTLMHHPETPSSYLTIDGQVCFPKWPFTDAVVTTRVNFLAPRGINRTACGAKLFLLAVVAYPVDYISSCHILKAQHCCMCLNGCFLLPSALHPLPAYPL